MVPRQSVLFEHHLIPSRGRQVPEASCPDPRCVGARIVHRADVGEIREQVCESVRRSGPTGIPVDALHVRVIVNANGRATKLSSQPDLRAELSVWCSLSATAEAGPSYKTAAPLSQVNVADSDTSSN